MRVHTYICAGGNLKSIIKAITKCLVFVPAQSFFGVNFSGSAYKLNVTLHSCMQTARTHSYFVELHVYWCERNICIPYEKL